ncbi:MAG TPA: adenylate/guanylate cyclase domain-containing protein [Verrucomicrobiae bacterium]|nr:adenylate/guanylate cyclase domain-containing protein [Verrucomicrobiae bacterium]
MSGLKAQKNGTRLHRRRKARRPLAKIRHDLRTPINHIIGFSDMLLEEAPGKVSDGFLEDLQKIRAGGTTLLALINQHLSVETFPVATPDQHQLCHELRTPVNHIIGYTELLMDQCGDLGLGQFRADLEKINTAARTWLVLMEEHLIGAPAEAGVVPPRSNYAETTVFRRMDRQFHRQAEAPARQRHEQGGHLLLADDDAPNRDLLCRRLEKLGYQVTATGNGREALKLARKQKFDLVLLDLLMPGLDGREVLARLKADPKLKDMPVIMISALDQVEGIVRCIELGAEDYISKPFNPVFLRARIGAGLEKKRLRDREVSYLRQIQEEKKRSEHLLHIILPQDVAEELKATERVKPRRFENAGVLFCDIAGFTAYCDQHPPEEVVAQLQAVVQAFEEITARHGLEKIKTIGDSFMGTIGLGTVAPNAALNCVECGLAMIAAARSIPPHWDVRVGVHVGPVVAGVVGRRKYQYDVWGDTVNLAARMQASAEPGSVCVTAGTWALLQGCCKGRPLGRLEVKGKGALDLFRVEAASSP